MQVFSGFEKYLFQKQRCLLNMGEVSNPEDQCIQLVRPLGGGMVWVFQTHRKNGTMRPECQGGFKKVPELGDEIDIGTELVPDIVELNIAYRPITDNLFDTERLIYSELIAPTIEPLSGTPTALESELHEKYSILRASLV